MLLRATSTDPLLSPAAFAHNVRRYHWPWRTATLPTWQIITWKSGPSPLNSVHSSFAQRLPSRPVSRVSCWWTAAVPGAGPVVRNARAPQALLERAVGDEVGLRRATQEA